jgi:hypothetical protein
MAKVTIIPAQQSNAEFEPRNFTQVGGIYGAEIRPEDFLVYADISPYLPVQNEERANPEREPRFFRVR